MRMRLALASALLLLSVAPAAAAAAPKTHVVVMDKMKFGPLPANVKLGDVIVWENRDMFRHTATARNGAFDIDLQPGTKGLTVVRRTGAIPIVCKYHPGMRAVLRVTGK